MFMPEEILDFGVYLICFGVEPSHWDVRIDWVEQDL